MNGKKNNLKVCLAASAGGHLTQLLQLWPSWENYEVFYVTTGENIKGRIDKPGRVYTVEECNRKNPVKLAKVFFRCMKIALRERPDVVISTGAASGALMSYLCKMLGAKIVWMDSITNTQRLSLSGRLVRPIADLILTQWQDIAEKYPKVEYAGQVI